MSAAIVKTSLGIIAAIAAIALLQTSTALDAILMFAAAGEVPGTDIELTPAATMWTLGGFAAAITLLIFSGSIVRKIRAVRLVRKVAKAEMKAKTELAVAAAKPTRRKKAKLTEANVAAAEAKKPAAPVVVITLPGRQGRLSRAFRTAMNAIRHGVAVAATQLPIIWRELVARTQYALGVLRLYTSYGWRWLEPRLDRIGRSLVAKLNKPQDIKPVLDFLRMCGKVLSKWTADARTQVLRYRAKL